MITQNLNTGHSFGHCAFPHLVLQPFGCSFFIMSTVKEVWKKVSEFPMYEVSSLGRIKSWHKRVKGCIVKQRLSKAGSKIVVLNNNSGKFTKLVADIVAKEFVPNEHCKPYAVHLNGDKEDNSIINLAWMSRIEAINHLGGFLGIDDDFSKKFYLTEYDIKEIKNSYSTSSLSIKELAFKYKLPERRVSELLRGFFKPKDLSCEKWVFIEGFENYAVSNKGRVKSFARYKEGRILRYSISDAGYKRVVLCRDGIVHYYSIHRLVADSHIPNPHNKQQVNHINGDKGDNNVRNLEWVTQEENMKHAHETGLMNPPKGESCSFSKLTKQEVLSIRKERIEGGIKLRVLSKKYGVSESHISCITRNKSWKHL